METKSANFPVTELRCGCDHCEKLVLNRVHPDALRALQAMRTEYGKPLYLSSAYRCSRHPYEVNKPQRGRHNLGVAFDIKVTSGKERMEIVALAIKHGFKGFGFANTFIHIDMGSEDFRSWYYT